MNKCRNMGSYGSQRYGQSQGSRPCKRGVLTILFNTTKLNKYSQIFKIPTGSCTTILIQTNANEFPPFPDQTTPHFLVQRRNVQSFHGERRKNEEFRDKQIPVESFFRCLLEGNALNCSWHPPRFSVESDLEIRFQVYNSELGWLNSMRGEGQEPQGIEEKEIELEIFHLLVVLVVEKGEGRSERRERWKIQLEFQAINKGWGGVKLLLWPTPLIYFSLLLIRIISESTSTLAELMVTGQQVDYM